jgi:hypothetical protein
MDVYASLATLYILMPDHSKATARKAETGATPAYRLLHP